jgi:nucleoside 2-deoxyribosyltransferase
MPSWSAQPRLGRLRSEVVHALTTSHAMKTIYLAGPDVFAREASRHFERLEARCAALGHIGVRPSDGGLSQGLVGTGDEIAERIYRANVALILSADAVLANLAPFRNALEPDSGTVFEVGMAVALQKPVAAFLPNVSMTYELRVQQECGAERDERGLLWDSRYSTMIEEFGQPLNLMLSRSVKLFGHEEDALQYLAQMLTTS